MNDIFYVLYKTAQAGAAASEAAHLFPKLTRMIRPIWKAGRHWLAPARATMPGLLIDTSIDAAIEGMGMAARKSEQQNLGVAQTGPGGFQRTIANVPVEKNTASFSSPLTVGLASLGTFLGFGAPGGIVGGLVGSAIGKGVDRLTTERYLRQIQENALPSDKYTSAQAQNPKSDYFTNRGFLDFPELYADMHNLRFSDRLERINQTQVLNATTSWITKFLLNPDGTMKPGYLNILFSRLTNDANLTYPGTDQQNQGKPVSYWDAALQNPNLTFEHFTRSPGGAGVLGFLALPGVYEGLTKEYRRQLANVFQELQSKYPNEATLTQDELERIQRYAISEASVRATKSYLSSLGFGNSSNPEFENTIKMIAAYYEMLKEIERLQIKLERIKAGHPGVNENVELLTKLYEMYVMSRAVAKDTQASYHQSWRRDMNAFRQQQRQIAASRQSQTPITNQQGYSPKPQAMEPKQTPYLPFYMHGAK